MAVWTWPFWAGHCTAAADPKGEFVISRGEDVIERVICTVENRASVCFRPIADIEPIPNALG